MKFFVGDINDDDVVGEAFSFLSFRRGEGEGGKKKEEVNNHNHKHNNQAFVVHLAAYYDYEEEWNEKYEHSNVKGTKKILEHASLVFFFFLIFQNKNIFLIFFLELHFPLLPSK